MMKKLSKFVLVILMLFTAIPVFAEDTVTIENIMASTLNENVVLNATDSLDVSFNELNQDATYKVVLKNNTEDVLYVNDLVAENLSEEFIEFSLTDSSVNALLEPGKETEVEFQVKTLDITHAGRNVDDEVTLKFLLGDSVVNPETSSNWIIYIILIGTLLITLSTMFTKLDKKKKLSIFVIGTLVLGTTVVYANDDNTLNIVGKVTYTSQNLLQTSGIKLDSYRVSYTEATDIWKYADQVKNIIISDDKTKPEEYEYRFDLTTTNTKKIYGYLVENGNSKIPYDLYIVANGVIYAPEDSTGLFSFPNVETIKGLEFIEFDNTTTMTAMFMNDENLTSINASAINMANTTNTSYMFNGCDKLNVSSTNFDLSNVTNTSYMFNQNLSDVVKLNAKSDKDTNFASTPVTGTYMVESTKNDESPVYYYRGAVTNNNVIFGGYCWKIVRTTETGGVKLIYNGELRDAYENFTAIASTKYSNVTNSSSKPFSFNSSTLKWTSTNKTHNSNSTIKFSVATAGSYILNYEVSSEKNYDKAYFYKDGNLLATISGVKNGTIDLGNLTSSNIITVKYSKDVSIHSGNDNVTFYVASGTVVTPAICNNTGTASQIGSSIYSENTISEVDVNYIDSDIKEYVDNWYSENMLLYTSELEDTVWCNDRQISNIDGTNITYNATTRLFDATNPSINCSTEDILKVNTSDENNKLTYPVSLLTADEVAYSGLYRSNTSAETYLNNSQSWWTITARKIDSSYSYVYRISSDGYKLQNRSVDALLGVRPSISLKQGIDYISGTGTTSNPYIVE